MSPTLATTIGLAIYAALLLPLAWVLKCRGPRFVAVAYTTMIAVVAVHQTGFFQRSSLTQLPITFMRKGPSNDAQCGKVLQVMRELGLAVDQSDPAAPKIIGRAAKQIPAELHDVLIACSKLDPTATTNNATEIGVR